MSREKIQDEFTSLPVTRQRKGQLRHPEAYQARRKAYLESEAGKAVQREYQAKYRASEAGKAYQKEYQAKYREKRKNGTKTQ